MFCSILYPSSIRGLATPWTYFLHLSLSSVILIDSSTGSSVHVLLLSIQAVRGLSRLRAPGIVPRIISFFRRHPCYSPEAERSFGRIMEILYGAKNGVHAFGYNSAESERIWMKSGALWVHCWGLAQQERIHGLTSGGRIMASARNEAPKTPRGWGENWVSLAPPLCPLPRTFLYFWAHNGNFWCILKANFIAVELPVLHA